MKQIYNIATVIKFEYWIIEGSLWWKKTNMYPGCLVVKNEQYIFAESEEDAIEKYKRRYSNWESTVFDNFYDRIYNVNNKEFEEIINYWTFKLKDDCIHNKKIAVLSIGEENDPIPSIETLKQNMTADDFKDWWNYSPDASGYTISVTDYIKEKDKDINMLLEDK